ncbi:YcaO-like family protein [Devosia sp.]|uniref:YcaO-like family protein n=1 Tax=Devosia sp. TaxID=1871048 RepID=UPI0035B4206B
MVWAAGQSAVQRAPARRPLLHEPFQLVCPDAGNIRLICASVRPEEVDSAFAGFPGIDVAGCDLDGGVAMRRCEGEAAEYLSQLSPPGDPRRGGAGAPPAAFAGVADELVAGVRLADGAPVGIPASACLRRSGEEADPMLGSGCAAGRTLEEAIDAAAWEVLERHAVACWWHGGVPPQGLDPALEEAARDYLERLRGSAAGRVTRLLDISVEPGAPTIVACSFAAEGKGAAFGFAAGRDPLVAAQRAVRELLQMEAGLRLIAYRTDRGLPLGEADQRALRRATCLGGDEPAFALRGVRLHPAESGADIATRWGDAFAVDLSTPRVGLPVAKVIIPALAGIPDEARWVAEDPARVALL